MPTFERATFDEELAEIMYMDGKSDVEISDFLGVDRQVICRWRQRKVYPSNIGLFNWQSTRCRKCSNSCKAGRLEPCKMKKEKVKQC